MNIIFQDIDGPLIPHRLYFGGDRPHNGEYHVFDPVAVAMINQLTEKCDAQVVFNSAWCNGPAEHLEYHARMNHLERIHPTVKTKFNTFAHGPLSRKDAIDLWLLENGQDIGEWIDIDDMPVYKPRQVEVNYVIGMTVEDYKRAYWLLSGHEAQVATFISYRHDYQSVPR